MLKKGFAPIIIILVIAIISGLIAFRVYNCKNTICLKDNNIGLNFFKASQSSQNTPFDFHESRFQDNRVKLAFLKDDNVYLYDNGETLLIAQSYSSSEGRIQYSYPFVSPNGKFLAYIRSTTKTNSEPENNGSNPIGELIVIKLFGRVISTKYQTDFYSWNGLNQIELKTTDTKLSDDFSSGKATFIVYDPSTEKELDSLTTAVEKDGYKLSEFPINNGRKIDYKNNNFYLIDRNKKETILPVSEKYNYFVGWSPSGKYAVFYGYGYEPTYSGYLVINTYDLTEAAKEIPSESGGAGGELGTGLKWYFDRGFVPDCSEKLYFVDHYDSLELTTTHGGGCNNSEGSVSTSGDLAIVKFDDRFELHSKNGTPIKINESTPITKTRFTPKNIIWINNNDYAALFESTVRIRNIGESGNKIFLFDRKTNLIKPIIDNGYLVFSAYSN